MGHYLLALIAGSFLGGGVTLFLAYPLNWPHAAAGATNTAINAHTLKYTHDDAHLIRSTAVVAAAAAVYCYCYCC